MKNPRRITYRLIALLVLCLSASQAAFAQAPDSHYSPPAALRALVADALSKVASARAALQNKQTDYLAQDLAQAQIDIGLIKALRPNGEINALTLYLREHLAFEDNQQALADILPLQRALSRLNLPQQATIATQDLNRVEQSLQSGTRAQVIDALDDMQKNLSVNELDFPLRAAAEKLRSISRYYNTQHKLPETPTLLGVETDLLQILSIPDSAQAHTSNNAPKQHTHTAKHTDTASTQTHSKSAQ